MTPGFGLPRRYSRHSSLSRDFPTLFRSVFLLEVQSRLDSTALFVFELVECPGATDPAQTASSAVGCCLGLRRLLHPPLVVPSADQPRVVSDATEPALLYRKVALDFSHISHTISVNGT